MSTVTIEVDGAELETLAELLRPGLRAVVVGLNPSNESVDAGHYFQGRLGLRLWQRLQQAGILRSLPRGGEDDEAFRQGIGFAKAFAAVGPLVRERGYEVFRMPGPYAPADQVAEELAVLGRALGVADCA